MNIKVIVIVVLCTIAALCGVYNFGYNNGVEAVEQQVAELNRQHEAKIKSLQEEHANAVSNIQTQYTLEVSKLNEQVAMLQNDKSTYQQYIGSYIPSSQYSYVPNGFVVWHDRAAKGERLDKIVLQGQLDDPSKYTYNDAMYAIGYNYSQANVCYKRLDALQTIVKDYMKKQK